MIESIKVKVGGVVLELSVEDARALHGELAELFGKTTWDTPQQYWWWRPVDTKPTWTFPYVSPTMVQARTAGAAPGWAPYTTSGYTN